ncbi:MAG TPA: alpha/beta fold hydrolase, partial [Chroococcidiopsis sp.]
IHADGRKPPLFCIHAAGGHVIFYQRLVRHLPDRPIYGLQAQGLDGEQSPLTSVEAMAAHYIAEMKTVQPHGPYYLGGLSFGGFVAFEMARQLQVQGDTVALVALLDTRGPNYLRRSPLPWLRYQLQRVSQQGTAYVWQRLRANLSPAKRDAVAAKLPDLTKQLGLDTANPNAKEIQRVVEANLRAAAAYRPQPYRGKVAVFRAAHEPVLAGWVADPSLGWGNFSTSASLSVYDIPSRHFEMFDEPHIQHLATQLQRSLDAAAPSP